jgi:hypothetical protein
MVGTFMPPAPPKSEPASGNVMIGVDPVEPPFEVGSDPFAPLDPLAPLAG